MKLQLNMKQCCVSLAASEGTYEVGRLTCRPGCRPAGRLPSSSLRQGRRLMAARLDLRSGGQQAGTAASGTSRSLQSPLSTARGFVAPRDALAQHSPLRSKATQTLTTSPSSQMDYFLLTKIIHQCTTRNLHLHGSRLRLVSYLKLHDPPLVGDDIMCYSVHLAPISIATHHHSIRGAAETLH